MRLVTVRVPDHLVTKVLAGENPVALALVPQISAAARLVGADFDYVALELLLHFAEPAGSSELTSRPSFRVA